MSEDGQGGLGVKRVHPGISSKRAVRHEGLDHMEGAEVITSSTGET